MRKMYVTFGQDHRHDVGDLFFNKDCVAVINCDNYAEGRHLAFATFGPAFCFTYLDDEFNHNDMHFFPRGFIELNPMVCPNCGCAAEKRGEDYWCRMCHNEF